MNVRLSARNIGKMLTCSGMAFSVVEGVPGDAKVVGVNYIPEKEQFVIGYEHDSFKDVPEGELIPEQQTTIQGMQEIYREEA